MSGPDAAPIAAASTSQTSEDGTSAGEAAGLLRWRPRLTFRARLTLTFTGLLAVVGALMVVAVTVFMRTVPSYPDSISATLSETGAELIRTPADPSSAPTYQVEGGLATSSGAATGVISLQSSREILDTTLLVSVLVLLALVVIGAVIAWLVAGRMLRPLQSVNDAAKLAGTGSFDHRLGLSGPRDEVRDLADTFDEMLGRLDRAFSASDRFAANASHELRTPLAATQTMLEVALADPAANAAELRAVAQRVLETNRRGIETVEALLDLSEVEHRDPARVPVAIGRIAEQAVREASAEIDARGIGVTIAFDPELDVPGDQVLLRQAVGNLVRNAVRHNVEGGTIEIEVLREAPSGQPRSDRAPAVAESIVLRVENSGPVLDAGTVASLVEPFVRGAGRTAHGVGGSAGHGLGLAIVESVARAHGGVIELSPRTGGGLIAELRLPA